VIADRRDRERTVSAAGSPVGFTCVRWAYQASLAMRKAGADARLVG
jgi:hypothetical protein